MDGTSWAPVAPGAESVRLPGWVKRSSISGSRRGGRTSALTPADWQPGSALTASRAFASTIAAVSLPEKGTFTLHSVWEVPFPVCSAGRSWKEPPPASAGSKQASGCALAAKEAPERPPANSSRVIQELGGLVVAGHPLIVV